MRTYSFDFLPTIQKYSKTLDDLTFLVNKRWVSVDNILNNKTVYTFRGNNDLLISINGKVEKLKWNYLENQSISIDTGDSNHLLTHGFYEDNILLLRMDDSKKYVVFVNESKYDRQLNSIPKVQEFLELKYLWHKRDYQYKKMILKRRKKSFEDRKKRHIEQREHFSLNYNKIWSELYLLSFVVLLLVIFAHFVVPLFKL